MTGGFRKAVLFILLLGVAVVGYQYMIKPANRDLTKAKRYVETKSAKLEEVEKNIPAPEDLSKQLEQLQEAVEFFESRLPPTNEIDKVLHDVTVIVQKQGLRSKRVLRLKQKDNGSYIEQPLKMELEGNFNAFYLFLLELEKLPRIMKIRELELKKQAKGEGQITANFIVSIFFQNITG